MMQQRAVANASSSSGLLDEVLHGLSLPQKALPSRFLYDDRGSELFEQITDLPEYYLTRTEIALLKSSAPGIREAVPAGAAIVEFGSGSSRKTELLLESLDSPGAYIPIDISASALYPAASRIAEKFPGLRVHPVLGDFHDPAQIKLPFEAGPARDFFQVRPSATSPAWKLSLFCARRGRFSDGMPSS